MLFSLLHNNDLELIVASSSTESAGVAAALGTCASPKDPFDTTCRVPSANM